MGGEGGEKGDVERRATEECLRDSDGGKGTFRGTCGNDLWPFGSYGEGIHLAGQSWKLKLVGANKQL